MWAGKLDRFDPECFVLEGIIPQGNRVRKSVFIYIIRTEALGIPYSPHLEDMLR